MNLKQRSLKMFGRIFVLGLATLLVVACGSANTVSKVTDGAITVCHATGNTDTPYDQLTIDLDQLDEHSKHQNDIIPAPADGCPQTLQENANDGKIGICHATNSASNPYNEITIDFNGLRGHGNHENDIIPAPETGCPDVMVTATTTLTPTITTTPTITVTPTITATPAATTVGGEDEKITICHATGSKKNSYVMITISVNGLNGHDKHARDIIPAPAGGCPK